MEEEKLPAEWRPAMIIKDKNIDDGKESDWAGHPGIMQSSGIYILMNLMCYITLQLQI